MWNPFTEEHEHFRSTVRRFVEQEIAPFASAWEKEKDFPSALFKQAGELGILGAHYPEDKGGGGGDYWFSVAKAQELPRGGSAGITMALLVQTDMATPVIADLGTPEQIDEFLKPALAGERIASIGVSEPGAGSDVAGIRTHARRDGDDYVINGQKTFITNGTRASFITLLAKTNPESGAHGCSFFLVPTDLPGFKVSRKLEKIGNHASDTAELFFENVRIPKRYLLGEENMGFMYLMQNFQAERLIGAVSGVAGARLAVELSRKYGEDRVAFGKPIIKREIWQHKFVQMYTKIEMAEAFINRCVDAYDTDKYVKRENVSFETVKLISMAKIVAGELVSEVMDTCLQFHGGWGYVEEYPIARAWRDARLLRIGGGTTETMTYYLAKLMGL
ncbi:MAG: acyl-CoA dehydrogenase family protein [Sorangiineae bacterium]|nr:acyl-CoA dehydrogenase family protein [Polyangiaceae bacterium]MEB2324081.1 acyl-CoA dehydrogenase family protein [Sorangiineae bacterium]